MYSSFITLRQIESKMPLKHVQGGVRVVAFTINSHEQTQLNRIISFPDYLGNVPVLNWANGVVFKTF